MAEAFGRGPGGSGASAFAPSVFKPDLLAFARQPKHRAFMGEVEAALDAFVESEKRSGELRPMTKPERAVVHEAAALCGTSTCPAHVHVVQHMSATCPAGRGAVRHLDRVQGERAAAVRPPLPHGAHLVARRPPHRRLPRRGWRGACPRASSRLGPPSPRRGGAAGLRRAGALLPRPRLRCRHSARAQRRRASFWRGPSALTETTSSAVRLTRPRHVRRHHRVRGRGLCAARPRGARRWPSRAVSRWRAVLGRRDSRRPRRALRFFRRRGTQGGPAGHCASRPWLGPPSAKLDAAGLRRWVAQAALKAPPLV